MTTKDTLIAARQTPPTLLKAVKESGGAATVRELEGVVVRELGPKSAHLEIGRDKSRTKFQYRFAWTRSCAKRDGLMISERRNRWDLASVKPEA